MNMTSYLMYFTYYCITEIFDLFINFLLMV